MIEKLKKPKTHTNHTPKSNQNILKINVPQLITNKFNQRLYNLPKESVISK